MNLKHTIDLNANSGVLIETGRTFKAGDKGHTFEIKVSGVDSTGTAAKICFKRANGTSVDATVTATGGVYSYTTQGNEFAVPGRTIADVKFYESTTKRISTASFAFMVEGDTLDGIGAGAAGYDDRIEQLVQQIEETGEELESLATQAENTGEELDALVVTANEAVEACDAATAAANTAKSNADAATSSANTATSRANTAAAGCEAIISGVNNAAARAASSEADAEQAATSAMESLASIHSVLGIGEFSYDAATGILCYTGSPNENFTFAYNEATGMLSWQQAS